jgi:sulfatase maturation enzyme AslB (radical SAM superfamily)
MGFRPISRVFDLEAAGGCNLTCPFCPRELLPPTGNMSLETFTRFLDHVDLGPADWISFCGIGEPTLNRALPDFIRLAKTRYPGVNVSVTTNGTRLDSHTLPPLLDAGLNVLDVSFNGIDAPTYERLMKGASFEDVLANLDYATSLVASHSGSTRLQVNFIVSPENAANEEDVKTFLRGHGVNQFRVQRMHDRSGTVQLMGMTADDAPGLRAQSCRIFDLITHITWQGDVVYCCHDVTRSHKIGNIREDTWGDLVRAKAAIVQEQRWLSICSACTDPMRHDGLDVVTVRSER